jgi:hypothetical protein
MAKAKTTSSERSFSKKSKIVRKGIIAKSKTSRNKRSKNYLKPKVGQG